MSHTQFSQKLKEAYEALQKIPPNHLNIMGYVDESQVNSPGSQTVIWLQGCFQECQGCFNPESWPFAINQLISVDTLAERILSNPNNEGVTFSGGEPFWQARSLAKLAQKIKGKGLNIIVFTGFTLEKLRSKTAPLGAKALLEQIDILIDGPYMESLAIHSPDSPISSRNQRIHILNPALQDKITWTSDRMAVLLKDKMHICTASHEQM